jgi:glucose-6-phosphate isomerase
MTDSQHSINEHSNARTQLPSWQALVAHKAAIGHLELKSLFAEDSDRFTHFSLQVDDLLVDYSKNFLTGTTVSLLTNLANDCGLPAAIENLFSGRHMNSTEDRPALHTALRNLSGSPVKVDGEDVMPGVNRELSKMKTLVEKLHAGQLLGCTGKAITAVVNIGVGGSDLGSVMATEALLDYAKGPIKVHFVSAIDGTHLADVLDAVNPETTLFLISSKSFTTLDTMTNAEVAKQWLSEAFDSEIDVGVHLAGVSVSEEAMAGFGIPENNRFYLWDWVGGRYSLASAVGLPLAIAIGFDNFKSMLEGMHVMDTHFRSQPLDQNIPVLLGLLNIWYINFFDAHGQVMLPYDSRMHRFPAYLQQLEMESLGKRVTHAGDLVGYRTGAAVWGEPGPNAQHSFYQLLHQGTHFIPADFLAPVNRQSEYRKHHGLSLANCLAQSRALMEGQSAAQVITDLEQAGHDQQEIDRIVPHKVHPGNKPSNLILFKRLDPKTLGMLIALYEHRVFVQSVIWDVNAFDQWGVELGKRLASELEPVINADATVLGLDGSTRGILGYVDRWKGE